MKVKSIFCLFFGFILLTSLSNAYTVIIPKNSIWSYNDSGVDLGTTWRELSYNDSSWKTGAAELGYGDGDETTVISYGPDPNNKYPTYYFRKKFNVADTTSIVTLKLRINYDDGFVAYINSVEVARSSNMGAGTVTYNTYASPDHEGGSFEIFYLNTSSLLVGENILAIEVHQCNATSSDVGFNLELGYEFLFHIHLTWDRDGTDTTVIVTWATSESVASVVQYGLTDSYGSEVSGSTFYSSSCGYYIHTVLLEGLTPDTLYHYRCGSSGKWSDDHAFTTGLPKGSRNAFTFGALGDSRSDDYNRNLVKEGMRFNNPRFSIHSGDLVEDGTIQSQWNQWFETMENLISNSVQMPALGNHEKDAQSYFDQFVLPGNEKWFSFNYGNAHFICIYAPYDTSTVPSGSEQYNWLEADLQKANSDPDITWKFAFWHVPPYSSGSHGSNLTLRSQLTPLLEQYGVDICFLGHDHTYERTYMLNYDAKIVQTDPNFKSPAGTIYVLTGGAGAPLYDFVTSNTWTAYKEKCYQFCLLTVDGNKLYFKSLRPDGTTVFDQFTILKQRYTSSLKVSQVSIPADENSVCTVTITIKSDTGSPLANKVVTISTARGLSYTTVQQQPGLTDSNGQCTGTIKSGYAGGDTVIAYFEGMLIEENLTPNSSFEDGNDTDAYYWTETNIQHFRTNDKFHLGAWSLKGVVTGAGRAVSDSITVATNSTYRLSGWIYNSLTVGNAYYTLVDTAQGAISGSPWLFSTLGRNAWEYLEGTWNNTTCTSVRIWAASGTGPQGTDWFDDIRLQRVPTVDFTAKKIEITSFPFTITKGNPSPPITIEAQGILGGKDSLFSETVVLESSSGGNFSLSRTSWADTTIVKLTSGSVALFYKNVNVGPAIITVSREGLISDTQVEIIVEPFPDETFSYLAFSSLSVHANGIDSITVVVSINDTYGYPVSNRFVTLISTRGPDSTTISTPNPQNTDANGKCTFTISSSYFGEDTITAICEGKIISRPLYQDLAGCWDLNESTGIGIKDISGNSNDGLIYGANWTGGKYGSALQFDGVDDYAEVPHSSSLNISGSITLEAWVLTNKLTGSQRILRKAIGVPVSGYGLRIISGGAVQFILWNPGGGYEYLSSTMNLSTGTWYHIVGTYDGKTQRIYINGEEKGKRESVFAMNTNTYPVTIGSDSSKINPFYGIIDEIRIYNRALTQQEVKAIYQRQSTIYFSPKATRLKIITPSFATNKDIPSPVIVIEAQDNSGNRDVLLNETASLLTTSSSGVFSQKESPWSDTMVVLFLEGKARVYYKDGNTGNPVITISRTGLISDGQAETIVDEPMLFNFVQITDAHFGEYSQNEANLRKAIEEINSLSPLPAFVLITGDVVSTDKESDYTPYKQILAGLKIPYYAVPGNHEVQSQFENQMGPTDYSFDYGNCHFIGFDDAVDTDHVGYISSAQFAWLETNLATAVSHSPPYKHIFLFFHIPIQTPYGGTGMQLNPSDGERLLSLIYQYRVKAVFSGHIHMVEELTLGDTYEVKLYHTAATSWNFSNYPVGYRLVRVYPYHLITEYKPITYTSYFKIVSPFVPADGTSMCTVSINIRNETGVALAGKAVSISTTRGSSYDSIAQPGPTDSNGQCTGYIFSSYAGEDTLLITCEGMLVRENIIQNFSFEEGSSNDAYYWAEGVNHIRSSDKFLSGKWSLRSISSVGTSSFTDSIEVYPKSIYKLSGWIYNSLSTGSAYFDLNNIIGEVSLVSTNNNNTWQYLEECWNNNSYKSVVVRCVTDGSPSGTVWFDELRLERCPSINFTAARLRITSSPSLMKAGEPSTSFTVEAQGKIANRDLTFSETISLLTSSNSGSFSLSGLEWSDTNIITLSNGSGTFYHRDNAIGTPTITVYRSGLILDTISLKVRDELIPPMFPIGLKASISDTNLILIWNPVAKNSDGTDCTDLNKYYFYRSTVRGGPYTKIAEIVNSDTTYIDSGSAVDTPYYYILTAIDNDSYISAYSSEIDNKGNIRIRRTYGFEGDTVSCVYIPKETAKVLYKENNSWGKDIRMEMNELTGQNMIRGYEFKSYKGDTQEEIKDLKFENKITISIYYNVAEDYIQGTTIPAFQVKNRLGLFFWNGLEWIKLGGTIDTDNQTLLIQTEHLSRYAIMTTTNATKLTLTKRIPPIITPNGDGINDICFFYYENPNNKNVTGKIYDLSGSVINSQLLSGPVINSLKWDGKDDYGNAIESGIYIYQLQGGDELISGSIVIAR